MPSIDFQPLRSTDTLTHRTSRSKSQDPAHRHPIEIRALRYRDVFKAAATMTAALKDDPLERYLDDTPDAAKSHLHAWRKSMVRHLSLVDAVRQQQTITVDGGVAIALMGLPSKDNPNPPGTLDRALSRAKGRILSALKSFNSPEQKKRQAEMSLKTRQALRASIGGELAEFFRIGTLCTAPAMQGRGCGTALVRHVTAQADAAGRRTWLASSNTANDGFYESVGFTGVAEFTLGEDEPAWKEHPVVIRIMVRLPVV